MIAINPITALKWAIAGALVLTILLIGRGCGVRAGDAERDELQATIADMKARLQDQMLAGIQAARTAEQDKAKALADIGAAYEKGKEDANASAAAVVADLRAGNLRLRDHWQGCVATAGLSAASAAAASGDGGAELRARGAGDLVRLGARCDAQVRALQATVREDRGAR
jgi:hypothetical protein